MVESATRTLRATRDRYEPLDELGHGASATVWRARDTRTGRDVALKRFHPHLVADPVARRRIEHEAAAASRVSHPSILSAVELIDDRKGLALVFPYVPGRTLAARLNDGPRVAPGEAAAIALNIADALAVAHSYGVVHRDVKPGNILLGADGRARLLDFGISRALDAGQDAHDLTGAGMTVGTLPYMAPEQLAAEPTTPASDVYALGVVLYEMLSGHRPYEAASPVTLAREQWQPPADIPDAPEPLLKLALAAMSVDAGARPDAAQLARGLSAWREGRGDADAPTRFVVAAPSRKPRPPAAWVAIGLAVLILAAALPLFAAGIVGSGAPASPGASAPGIALVAPPTGLSPSQTQGPTQAPVVNASDTQPTRPTNGNGSHPAAHHSKKHHGKHHPPKHHGKHHPKKPHHPKPHHGPRP